MPCPRLICPTSEYDRVSCLLHFSFGFDCAPLDTVTKAQLAVTLFLDLVDPVGFDRDKLLRFCLTVSKNYRPIPYHNWEHAFSVAHCMYYVIKGVPQMFSEIEVSSPWNLSSKQNFRYNATAM